MQDHNLLTGHQWQPLTDYGFTHKFWTINIDTLMSSIIVTIFLISFSLFAHYVLQQKQSILRCIILKYVESFKDLLFQTLQSAPVKHLAFIGSLFTFIFCCNIISLIPFIEEPTKDINTTLALALIAIFYVQINSIKENGIRYYISEFFKPFFIMLPLHVIGKVTPILSLSFRLFGNIFGGYVISTLWFSSISSSIFTQIAGSFLGINLLLQFVFCIFDGTIQAFVFSMLTLTYLSMEIAPQEPEKL